MTRTKRIRETLGWTQAEMGRYLGLAGPSVSRIEHGQAPRPGTEKLLDQLERDVADGRVKPSEPKPPKPPKLK